MKFRAWLVAGVLFPVVASAQLDVSVTIKAETFLLYEAVPVVVNLHNFSGRTVELQGGNDASWLSFLITGESGRTVEESGQPPAGGAVLIPPGETVSRTFDLMSLYDLRTRGTYRVRAEVASAGIHVVSAPARFTLMRGQELWRQTVGLGGAEDRAEEYRTYELVAKRGDHESRLYVGVHDDQEGLVYAMFSIGTYLPLTEPKARVDARGYLHVLHRNGARTFGYHVVNPRGEVVEQGNYADLQTPPRLVAGKDGLVAVEGGEKMVPRAERVLTDAELNPPPPPPPKKKPWWQFWRKVEPAPSLP